MVGIQLEKKQNKPLAGDDFKNSIFLYNCLFLVSTGLIIVTPLFLTTTGWAAVGLATSFDSCLSFALLSAGIKKTLQLNFVYNSTTSQADSSNTYHIDICQKTIVMTFSCINLDFPQMYTSVDTLYLSANFSCQKKTVL